MPLPQTVGTLAVIKTDVANAPRQTINRVITANALAYALGIPVSGSEKQKIKVGKFNVVEPIYDREPEITKKKSRKA